MQSQSLKEYHWENRIIVLVHEKSETTDFQKQNETLLKKETELEDRDLIILLLKEDLVLFADGSESELDAKQIRNDLKIDPDFEGVILIGLDGSVKLREKFQVAPQKIFDLIDSMPIRRAELKN